MPEPTLSQLVLAYDRLEPIGEDYQRLFRGGLVTMQGELTHEGEMTLISAYRLQTNYLQGRVRALVAAGNKLARIPGIHPTSAEAKRHWRDLVKEA
jgi:hypothetical protein